MPKIPSVGGGKLDPGGWAGGEFALAFVAIYIPAIFSAPWPLLVGLGTSSALIKVMKMTGWKAGLMWLALGIILSPVAGVLLGGVVNASAPMVTPFTNQAVTAIRPALDSFSTAITSRT